MVLDKLTDQLLVVASDAAVEDLGRKGMTIEEYLKIQENLLTSRREIKGEMSRTTNVYEDARSDMLETYRRLYTSGGEGSDCGVA